MRTIACSLLVAISLSLAAPALQPAPAYAGTAATTNGGLPPIPWAKVAQWVMKNALPLLMLAEEIWRDMQGHEQNPPPETPPAPNADAPECEIQIGYGVPDPAGGLA